MEGIQEQPPFVLSPNFTNRISLNDLQTAASNQIAALMQQSLTLDGISTDLRTLITSYNAQKSYLGYAAQWYGEKNWWLQIILIIVAAGIVNLLFLPAIISLALSALVSFLLLNHHKVSQEHDRLISEDLVNQNESVQEMQQLLRTTKENLENNLLILCKMNQDMSNENIKLRHNVDAVTQQVAEQQNLNSSLRLTIAELQTQETQLNDQLSKLQEELVNYKSMIENGTLSLVRSNQTFSNTTASLIADSKELHQGTTEFCEVTQHLRRKVAGFPEIACAPEGSQSLMANGNRSSKSAYALKAAEQIQRRINGVNITDERFSALDNEIEQRSPHRSGNNFQS